MLYPLAFPSPMNPRPTGLLSRPRNSPWRSPRADWLGLGGRLLGVSRLVGAIIEASHDDKGIIWPESVTPFHAGLVNLRQGDAVTDAACEKLYAQLHDAGLEVLYHDTDERAGAKFATMELIGLPWRFTVGPRGLERGVVELTSRRSGETEELAPESAVARLCDIYRGL